HLCGHHPAARTAPDPATAAADVLFRLQSGLRRQDRSEVLASGDPRNPAARAQLIAVAANVRALRIHRLALRYVDSSEVTLSPPQRERYGADAWVADVQVTWRMAGVDRAASTVEVPVVLGWRRGRAVYEDTLAAGPHQG